MLTLVDESREQTENRHAERRRGLRISQARPIKIFEPASLKFLGGQTADVSATGLRIELPMSASITEGKLVNIHVGLSDTGQTLANRRDMIPARIVWLTRRGERLMAGVEFLASIAARLDAA